MTGYEISNREGTGPVKKGSVGSTQGLTARIFPGKILTGYEISNRGVTSPVKKGEYRVNTRLDCQDVPR